MKPDVLYVTEGRIRDGVDGVRDVDAPCAAFRNGVPSGDCESDGHYICQECTCLHPRKTPAGKLVELDAELERCRTPAEAEQLATWARRQL